MRKLAAGLMLAAVMGFVGCNETPPATQGGKAAGGSGQSEKEHGSGGKAASGNGAKADKDSFTLQMPWQKVDIAAGDSEEAEVDVNRDGDFKEAVTVTFKAPTGITVTAASDTEGTASAKGVMVGADEDDVKVRITVAATVPEGDHEVRVMGNSDSGKSTDGKFTVHVDQKNDDVLDPQKDNDAPILPDADNTAPAGTNQ